MIKFFILLIALSITGCGTTIKKEVASLEYDIQSSQSSINKSSRYLKYNSKAYVNGGCIKPARNRKPEPYCNTQKKAKEFSLSYCSMSIGCDVALLTMDNRLDTFSKRFLASEVCSQAINHLRGDGYSADDTIMNIFESGSDSICGGTVNGFFSGLWKLAGCISSASIKIQKIEAYSNCINSKAKNCYSEYTYWINAPMKQKKSCENEVKNISHQEKKITNLSSALHKAKNTWSWKLFGGTKNTANERVTQNYNHSCKKIFSYNALLHNKAIEYAKNEECSKSISKFKEVILNFNGLLKLDKCNSDDVKDGVNRAKHDLKIAENKYCK